MLVMTKRRCLLLSSSVTTVIVLCGAGFITAQRRAQPLAENDIWAHVDGVRKPWRPVGLMDTTMIPESSGVVASRRYPGIFWTHNDSFSAAAIFAVTEDGKIVARVNVGAVNIDWEDIAIDDKGYLYIADTGNNLRIAMHRYIYKIPEPNPYKDGGKSIAPAATYTLTYPDKPFDAEALFVRDGQMYVISRHDKNRARIYRLDPGDGGALRMNEIAALRADRASGADVSGDGTSLAVCTTRQTWIYRVSKDMTPVAGARPTFVRYPEDQVEGCAFDGEDLILTNEKGQIFRVPTAEIEHKVIFVPPGMVAQHSR